MLHWILFLHSDYA